MASLSLEQSASISTLKVKLSADGTRVGRNINLVNFTAQLIAQGVQQSVNNVKTLGLSESNEEYENIKQSIGFISSAINDLPTIQFSNKDIPIRFIFVADWKLVAIVTGLYAANCNYPCIWCHWLKPREESDKQVQRKPVEGPPGPRTEEIRSCCLTSKTNHFGYKAASLLPNIPLCDILLDTLHMKLRICDRLCYLLVNSLCKLDRFTKGYFDSTHLNLSRWFSFIRNECKIRCVVIEYNKNNPAVVTRSFTGKEFDSILSKINIELMFPNVKDAKKVQKLWKSLESIISKLGEWSNETLKSATDEWHQTFVEIYRKEQGTPYTHALNDHLAEQVKEHGDISLFNQQSVEKLNDQTTREYFSATNKHSDYLHQMILRRGRIDDYEIKNNLCFL